MNIYVGGINAVGKSTTLKKVAEMSNYTYIHATSHLMDFFGFGSNYEKLRSLTQQERDIGLKKSMESIIKNNPNGNVLVDGHYMTIVRGKVNKVTDSWIQNFDALILFTADTHIVLERIIEDSSKRDRALFPPNISENEMFLLLDDFNNKTEKEFELLANKYKKLFLKIENKKDKQEETILELLNFITH